MFINKKASIVHLVLFRSQRKVYMTTTDDTELSRKLVNDDLRAGIFANSEFQQVYNLTKVNMGLLDPCPDDLLIHQFISTANLNGYHTGHWLIRDYLANNHGLHNITNIGDWLDDDGFIDITPEDQDKRKFVRVTDIGKYFAEHNCFDTGVYPLYILSTENNQINSSGLIETHRNEQPKRGGYDHIVYGEPPRLIEYNDANINLSDADQQLISDKPISANGRLYSSIDQFARARNIPTWFVLEQINAGDDDNVQLYKCALDWHFV